MTDPQLWVRVSVLFSLRFQFQLGQQERERENTVIRILDTRSDGQVVIFFPPVHTPCLSPDTDREDDDNNTCLMPLMTIFTCKVTIIIVKMPS